MTRNLLLYYLIQVILGITTSEILPILPVLIDSKSLSLFINGAIISMFSFTMFIFILLAPKISKCLGPRVTMLFSIIIQIVSTIVNGLCEFIDNKPTFAIICGLSRCIHGAGIGICSTLIFSFSASEADEKNSIDDIIGYLEFTTNIGELIGPIISSFLLGFKIYYIPFFACSLLSCLALLFSIFIQENKIIKEKKNENKCNEVKAEEEGEVKENKKEEKEEKQGKIINIIKHPNAKITLPLLCVFVDMIASNFFEPSLQIHYKSRFNLEEDISGYFFMIPIAAFVLTIKLFTILVEKKNHFVTMLIGILLNAIFCLFIGPVYPIPHHLSCGIIGLAMIGATSSLMTIPQFVPMLDALKNEYNIENERANDYGSVIYNLVSKVGDGVGPILGGILDNYLNFDITCIIMCGLNVLTAGVFVVYIILAKIQSKKEEAIKEDKRNITSSIEMNML